MKNLALLKNAPNFAVILSLLLVAFELNQNQQSLLESNNLARIQAANNAFVGSTAVRQQQLENIEIWVKGSKMESLDETEEAVFRILCGSYIFNLGNLYEADFYSGNTEKINSRIYQAGTLWGQSACNTVYPELRESIRTRGEMYLPLVMALEQAANHGSNGGVQN